MKTLFGSRIVQAELDRLQTEIQKAGSVEGRIERSSKLLTEITRNFGIAAAIPNENQTLDQVELLALPDRRILMVVVTRDRMVRNKVITIDDHISQEELASIRNYINYNFGGWMLHNIHRELKRRLELESATYDAILKRVSLFYSKGLLDLGLMPEVHFEGAENLIGLDLHLTRERMRDLFRTLEEKKRVLQLLERFLEQRHGELSIQVGLVRGSPEHGRAVAYRSALSPAERTRSSRRGAGTHAHELQPRGFGRVARRAGVQDVHNLTSEFVRFSSGIALYSGH